MQRPLEAVQNFVRAKTPRGLVRLMLRKNIESNSQLQFSTPQFANGFWYAWFYDENLDPELLLRKTNKPE